MIYLTSNSREILALENNDYDKVDLTLNVS